MSRANNITRMIGDISNSSVTGVNISGDSNTIKHNHLTNKSKSWISENWIYVIVHVIEIILLSVILAKLCFNYDNGENSNTLIVSIVLSFTGILATFIVVTNYAQVKDIENKTKEDVSDIVDKLEKIKEIIYIEVKEYIKETENIASEKINAINSRIDNIAEKITVLENNFNNEKLENNMEKVVSQNTEKILERFSALWFPGREKIISERIKQAKNK